MFTGYSMTKLIGILSVADKAITKDKAVEIGNQLFSDGADIVDIGAHSQRLGLMALTEQDELERLIPVIQILGKSITIPIAIDTFHPKVAERAIESGATIINDGGGFISEEMRQVAKNGDISVVLMHSLRTKDNKLQSHGHYPDGVVAYLLTWFERQIEELLKSGISEKNIIVDPGIGFGKTVADNFEIIQNLHKFKALKFPLLIGASRKSFLGQFLNRSTEDLLSATLVINTLAALAKTDFIRVHDIREHKDMLQILNEMKV